MITIYLEVTDIPYYIPAKWNSEIILVKGDIIFVHSQLFDPMVTQRLKETKAKDVFNWVDEDNESSAFYYLTDDNVMTVKDRILIAKEDGSMKCVLDVKLDDYEK